MLLKNISIVFNRYLYVDNLFYLRGTNILRSMFSHLWFIKHPRPAVQFGLPFIIVLLLSGTLSAQSTNEKEDAGSSADSTQNRLEIGVSAGLALNRFTKGQPNTGQNTGYTAGLSVSYKLYKNFGLQLETNFIQQGGTTITFKDDTRIGLPESFETKHIRYSSYAINSIEIPLLINYTFHIKQSWMPTVYAGGSYAYAYNITESYKKTGDLLTGEDVIATVSNTRDASSEFKSSRLNFVAGANLKLPLTSKLFFFVDFRYINGLSPVRENYSYMEKIGFGSDLRSNSLVTKLGMVIPL